MTNSRVVSFTLLNAYKYGNVLEEMLQLRYKGFILEEKYDVRSYADAFEFDQYDDPYAHYVTIFQGGSMIACSRIRRTDTIYTVVNGLQDGSLVKANITYMAKDIWADQISEEYLAPCAGHYEVTRVYTDSSLNRRDRMYAAMAILSATYGYAVSLGGVLGSFVTHNSLVNMTKNLGMKITSSCNIVIPNFRNQQYVMVDLSMGDFVSVMRSLYRDTKIDLTQFAKEIGLIEVLEYMPIAA